MPIDLIKKIETEKNINYGGYLLHHEGKISDYHLYHNELPKDLFLQKTKYCNGRFYLLSKKSINYLIKYSDDISKCIIEDHTIGLYLHDNLKINGLYFDTKKCFIDTHPPSQQLSATLFQNFI